MHDLTGFQRDILYMTACLEEPYSLAIKAELDDYYEHEMNHDRLYPNLDDLVDRGLFERGELDKRTNTHTLTQRGGTRIVEIETDPDGDDSQYTAFRRSAG